MPVMNGLEVFEIPKFVLQNGLELHGARLAYRTHGTLNVARDNAILFPGFLGGVPEALEVWIGEGRPLDPSKYFIILPGQFGIPPSTAPSNAPSPCSGAAFPSLSIADDVVAQELLLTEVFGITTLQLVLGWSVGALQTYEWAVRFPQKVLRMASIAGAPRPSPWTRMWLEYVIEEPLTSDASWNEGGYDAAEKLADGLRRVGHLAALTLPPKIFYRTGVDAWKSLGFTSVTDFVTGFWEAFWLPKDPNDLVAQARKARAADPAHGGEIEVALQRITAKVSIVAFTGDAMFPPEEGRTDAASIPCATFLEIQSNFGHLATFALSEADRLAVDAAIAECLTR
jgi:homoserine O-acetyltransferase/O-succinyltransferase